MNRNNNTSPNLLSEVPEDTAGLMSMTDSENSSSSSNAQIFDNQALVLELHELQRDELPDNPLPEVKTRKLSKKRAKRDTEQIVASLSSSSESLVLSTGQPESPMEEYFDAQGSNHDLSENSLAPSSPATPESGQDRSKTIPPPPSQEDPNKTIPTSQVSTAIIPAPALTAETAAQPDVSTTASQQTGSSNTAQQQSGPLSKPTESSKS